MSRAERDARGRGLLDGGAGSPLVHDEDGETGIEPPDGEIGIAWGGPPLDERAEHNRMHFVLGAGGLDAEVERLVGLVGAVVERGHDEVGMADPTATSSASADPAGSPLAPAPPLRASVARGGRYASNGSPKRAWRKRSFGRSRPTARGPPQPGTGRGPRGSS